MLNYTSLCVFFRQGATGIPKPEAMVFHTEALFCDTMKYERCYVTSTGVPCNENREP